MAKGVKKGPHQQRLISRAEAGAMVGRSPQTISNWVKKGVIKGYKFDNMLLVDKDSIERLLATSADVTEMERSLREIKRTISDEIPKRNQEYNDLYENNLTRILKSFLNELLESILDTIKDQLSEKKLIIVTGILKGKTTAEIAEEIGCTQQTVWNTWQREKHKIFVILEYPKLFKEKQSLAEENQKLKDVVYRSNKEKEIIKLKKAEIKYKKRIKKLQVEIKALKKKALKDDEQ